MAIYERVPRTSAEILDEYLQANVQSYSMSVDREGKLQRLEIDAYDDVQMALFIDVLKAKFGDMF